MKKDQPPNAHFMEEEVRAERIVEKEDRAWMADGAAAMVPGQ